MILAWIKHYYNSCQILIFSNFIMASTFMSWLSTERKSFIHSFIHWFLSARSMDFHFTQLVIIHYINIYFAAQIVPYLASGNTFKLVPMWLLTGPLKFLRFPCFLKQKDVPVSSCTLPASVSSPQSPDSCGQRMGFRNHSLGTRYAHCVLAPQRTELRNVLCLCMCTYTCLHLLLYLGNVKSYEFRDSCVMCRRNDYEQ